MWTNGIYSGYNEKNANQAIMSSFNILDNKFYILPFDTLPIFI